MTGKSLILKKMYSSRTSDQPQLNNQFLEYDNLAIRKGGIYGHCNLCGHDVLFSITHPNLRETLVCPICKSFNRQRQLVCALSLELYGQEYDLKDICSKMKKGTKILLLEAVTNLAELLEYYASPRAKVYKTEFVSAKLKSGDTGESGVVHLDIQKTHFPDGFFDIIIHADVFEHVTNAPKAEQEQLRILKRTGVICYTAPFEPWREKDQVRAKMVGGKIKYLMKAVYHGDPSPREDINAADGCLVFRVFSYADPLKRMAEKHGLFHCWALHGPRLGILGNNAFVFAVKKMRTRP